MLRNRVKEDYNAVFHSGISINEHSSCCSHFSVSSHIYALYNSFQDEKLPFTISSHFRSCSSCFSMKVRFGCTEIERLGSLIGEVRIVSMSFINPLIYLPVTFLIAEGLDALGGEISRSLGEKLLVAVSMTF